jgi:hypothetical protein
VGAACAHRERRAVASRLGGTRKAITLLETLVLVAILAILLAMLLPEIGSAKEAAQRTASLSNLRQHCAVMTMHCTDNRERFPYFLDPKATYTVLRHPRVTDRFTFFSSHLCWNIALAGYYDDNPFHDSFLPPGYQDGSIQVVDRVPVLTPYFYAHAFVASPDYWNPMTRTADRSQWTPTRQDMVVHPSLKGLILDSWTHQGQRSFVNLPRTPVGVGFVDGSARLVPRDGFLDYYPNGAGDLHYPFPTPVMHTIDGVRGRDVR